MVSFCHLQVSNNLLFCSDNIADLYSMRGGKVKYTYSNSILQNPNCSISEHASTHRYYSFTATVLGKRSEKKQTSQKQTILESFHLLKIVVASKNFPICCCC